MIATITLAAKLLRELEEATERAMNRNELEMMKRTNKPSYKIAMQTLSVRFLNQNQVSTNEFISKLGARGVSVIFQSGINRSRYWNLSYSY